jgi:hypothetical protein
LSAVAGAGAAWGVKLTLPTSNPIVVAVAVLVPYGVVYIGLTLTLGVAEARTALARVSSRIRR